MRDWLCPGSISAALLLLACAGDPAPLGKSESTSESSGPSESESSSTSDETDTDEGESESETDTGETADETDSSDTGELPAGCNMPSPGSGTHTSQTVIVDGVERHYDLFVPVTYDPQNTSPLVLNFHGLLGSPEQQADWSQFNEQATLRGMVVAYPEGIGASFNAGACCGEAASSNVDDIGFARALVDKLTSELCIDPRRVYATGMSNGGHMSHTLACEAADVFAAAASVTGVMGLDPADCQPARPISIMQFHGTADVIVQYNGLGPGYPPVEPMMEDWAARNGCDANSEIVFDQDDVRCWTWPNCDAGVEVTMCRVDGGGHCWFGNPECLFGASTTTIHASERIADMFLLQTLP